MAGMTAEDCNKMQEIQNSLNRLLTGARKGTPTKDLERTCTMSTMQMVAYLTRSIREEKKTKVFKESVRKWVKVTLGSLA